MNQWRNVVQIGLMLLLPATTLLAASIDDRGLGLRPPTAAEKTRFEAVSVPVTSLQPNALALARYRSAVAAAGAQGKTITAPVGLPPAVDNSTLQYFPPIRSQGSQGSCSAWATCYYYNTYTQAQDGGYDVSGGDNIRLCSPGFMYNLINGGTDGGSSIMWAMMRLRDIGCASWADKPYDQGDYISWPSETAWVNALWNRTSTPHTVDVSNTLGLATVKQHLANGNLAVISMQVFETWYHTYPADGTGINNGVYYARDGDSVGGHAVTLVGYDDSKSYVDHRDGQTHDGAFLIANSWGPWWGVENSTGTGNNGFFWVAYSAFLDGTLWYYGDSNAYYSDDRPDYRPSIYAVVGLNHLERYRVALNCSLGSGVVWLSQYAVYGDGGALPVSDADCLAVDMTDGIGFIGSPPTPVAARLEVDPVATADGTITRADFYEDLDGNGSYAVHSSTDPVVTVAPNTVGSATLSLTPASGDDYDITSSLVPSAVTWDETAASSVTVRNLGTSEWLVGAGYQLLVQDTVDRWGLAAVPLEADVAPASSRVFSFDLVAPPVSTLAYEPPVTDSESGVWDALPLSLTVALNSTPLTGRSFSQDIVISRFPDIQPDTAGAWARFHVEECAGRLPPIVGGYLDGAYRPADQVTRDQMAVFIQRALALPLVSYAGGFTDITAGYWAADQIQTLKNAGIVSGYEDGTYRPSDVVPRDAMAVFVARGMAGGDSSVPAGPGSATFSDVPTNHWAFRHVEYAVANGVVSGYGDGSYRPDTPVTRDQMAVYMYRGFMQSRGAAVVLAGPAVTAVDPAAGGPCGWTTTADGPRADPGFAYVAFDAVRLGPNLAAGGAWEVKLELRSIATPGLPATGSYTTTISLTGSQVNSIREAAKLSGEAYQVVSWDIPAALAPGDYWLVVSVEDDTGTMREVARRAGLTITP